MPRGGFQFRRWLACSVALCCASVACAQPATQIGPEELTDEHVQAAIDAIAAKLAERVNERTFWEPEEPPSGESAQPGGYTALAALALLAAGESYQGQRLKDAIENLERAQMSAVYGLAMRASLWAGLPDRFHRNLQSDAQQLLRGFQQNDHGWFYHVNGPPIYISNSRRMFGALGLWEAANRGVNIPDSVWRQLESAFIDLQLADGGWNYRGDGPATGSMTASGLATLFITQDHLHSNRFVNINPRRNRQNEPIDHAIERGMGWMDRNFTADSNPGNSARSIRHRYFYYYLYSLERAALASGYTRFGGRDWFREGAAALIHRLCEWDAESRTMTAHDRTYGDGRRAQLRTDDLAFALLFLSRGRVPVAVNKLRDESMDWNNRPRDVANFTAWLSDETATALNWQIADLDAGAESWLGAPLLYLASHRDVPWVRSGSPQLNELKRYLDLGGMLLAVNESGRQFADSIEEAGRLMYPHLQWRTLEPDHWAFNMHATVDRGRPRLRAIGNGVREFIILSSDDLARTFQSRRGQQRAHYETVANIYFCASEMNRPKPRLSGQSPANFTVREDSAPHLSVSVVHVRPGAAPVLEPQALHVLADALERASDLQLTVLEHTLDAIHEIEPPPELVLVSDVEAATFTQAERESILQYVERGGIMLFEQIGGAPTGAFLPEAEALAAELLGNTAKSMHDHPIITGSWIEHAAELSRVEYRPYSLTVTGSIETRPRLRGISHESGGMILLSREDLSHALLDQPCWGIHGYSPRSARALLRNILLYGSAASQADRSVEIQSDEP